jgi:hypothetical protein
MFSSRDLTVLFITFRLAPSLITVFSLRALVILTCLFFTFQLVGTRGEVLFIKIRLTLPSNWRVICPANPTFYFLNLAPRPAGRSFIYSISHRALANMRVFAPRPVIVNFRLSAWLGRRAKTRMALTSTMISRSIHSVLFMFSLTKMSEVIFCYSAGVGRTGTFIAVDYLLQHIKDHDEVDIFNLVLEMRNNRLNMVQTEVL